MPVVRMPNGDRVKFPDNMSRDEINFFIMEKFPNAAEHHGTVGQLARGLNQGFTSSVMDIASVLPQVPFLGAELPGLPEYARQARREATKETEKFVNEPSEGLPQSIGKFLGGATPYVAIGPTGLLGATTEAAGRGVASALPFGAGVLTHAVGHKLGLPGPLRRIVADFVRNHPGVMAAAQRAKPAFGRAFGAIGQSIESRGPGIAGGIREELREPERDPERKPPRTRPAGTYRGGREDRAQME